MKKILAISNSFGVDATRYFYDVARSEGKTVKVVTLFIGGCSLYRHYRNMLSDEKAYEYYINGINSGLKVSLKEALLSDEWSVVTLQQSSPKSAVWSSYEPYLTELSEYVKRLAPAAKQFIQATWSFADGCPRFAISDCTGREDMIPRTRECYAMAAEKIGAHGTIPSLDAMCKLYDKIGAATYRDGFHANYGSARYMLACLWYMVFFKTDISSNTFRDFDIEVSEEEARTALECAVKVARAHGFIKAE